MPKIKKFSAFKLKVKIMNKKSTIIIKTYKKTFTHKYIKNVSTKNHCILYTIHNDYSIIGPKIDKNFCFTCFNEKIFLYSKIKKLNKILLSKKEIIKVWKNLNSNQIAIIDSKKTVHYKFLLPTHFKHNCPIINSKILSHYNPSNVYGLLKSYSYNIINNFHIYRGVIDISNVNEYYLTVCGKSSTKKIALSKFLGEAYERYISHIKKSFISLSFSQKKKLQIQKKNAYLDWTKNTATTVGTACHTSRFKALKKAFYEILERNYLFEYAFNNSKIYYLKDQTSKSYNNFLYKSFYIENVFKIPIIITFSKKTHKNINFYGIGICADSSHKKAIKASLEESIQNVIEKIFHNKSSPNLSLLYEEIFTLSYPTIKIRNSIFLLDFLKLIKYKYDIEISNFNINLKKLFVFKIVIKNMLRNSFEAYQKYKFINSKETDIKLSLLRESGYT